MKAYINITLLAIIGFMLSNLQSFSQDKNDEIILKAMTDELNRNIEELILSGGFQLQDLKKKYIKGPKIASFLYYGEASKA